MPFMRPISLKLPKALDRRLTELARRRKTNRSALLREAFEAFAKRPINSVTAAAGDLVGSLEGPRDLASSPKHMSGYGR